MPAWLPRIMRFRLELELDLRSSSFCWTRDAADWLDEIDMGESLLLLLLLLLMSLFVVELSRQMSLFGDEGLERGDDVSVIMKTSLLFVDFNGDFKIKFFYLLKYSV
jgi:hypothetical protein